MGESLRLDLDSDALLHFFKALERERRQSGIVGPASRIEPRRRASLVELVLSLNLESAWGESEKPRIDVAAMTRMFAPLLAETGKARDALRRALETTPPGTFNLAPVKQGDIADRSGPDRGQGKKTPDREERGPGRRGLPLRTWAAASATLAIAAVVVAQLGKQGLSLSCLFRDQSQCATPPPNLPNVPPSPNLSQSPMQNPTSPPPRQPSAGQTSNEVYAQFLRTAAHSLEHNKSSPTPRELAEDFAAGDPAGPSAKQILEAMFAAVPRHPDLPLPSNAEDAPPICAATRLPPRPLSTKKISRKCLALQPARMTTTGRRRTKRLLASCSPISPVNMLRRRHHIVGRRRRMGRRFAGFRSPWPLLRSSAFLRQFGERYACRTRT